MHPRLAVIPRRGGKPVKREMNKKEKQNFCKDLASLCVGELRLHGKPAIRVQISG